MLKWILNLLVAFVVFRLFRAAVGPRPQAPPRRTRPRRGLDPDRAVSASWSEVEEREKEREKERDGTD